MKQTKDNEYEVVIVGGGITGTAILYILSNYTNINNIALIEKHKSLAQVNSNKKNNSQTLHRGEIETNYTYEKAEKVKHASDITANYLIKKAPRDIYNKIQKMALAVGHDEVNELEERFKSFKNLYPGLKLIHREELKKIEPKVIEGRSPDEPIAALYTKEGFSVDYGRLSESFAENSKVRGKNIDIFLDTKLKSITKDGTGYLVKTKKRLVYAKVLIVSGGAHSLLMAKRLGYGKEFVILPVAGNFYLVDKKLFNGKVYTMQIKGIPFAAVHGDPEVNKPDQTRFGPVAKVLLMLERNNYSTVSDFFKTLGFNMAAIISFVKILSDWKLFKYVVKSTIYDIPLIGKYFFVKEAKKIAPSLRAGDLKKASGWGGVRPQIVNTTKKSLDFGESKIMGENIIFNITPSPGASVSLENAKKDVEDIIRFLGSNYKFDKRKFSKDLIA